MLCKTLATLLLAATALATTAPEVTATAESFGTDFDNDAIASASSAADAFLADIPDSILSVMETAVPTSWQMDILTDPAFRASVASAAAEGSYPAWYNELPSSVKAWATSVGVQMFGDSPTATADSAFQTDSSLEAGSSYQGASQTVSQTASNAALTTPAGSSHATTSHSSSSSASASASASASSSQSTGGAPAPTGGVAMAVAGGAGILALALALVSALGNPDPDRKWKYFNFAPDSLCSGILRQLNLNHMCDLKQCQLPPRTSTTNPHDITRTDKPIGDILQTILRILRTPYIAILNYEESRKRHPHATNCARRLVTQGVERPSRMDG